MADFSLAALRAELDLNPSSIYSGDPRADEAAINLVRSQIQLHRNSIPMREVYAQVVWADFAALTEPKRTTFQIITSTDALDVTSANIRDAFVAIFGAGSTTLTNLQAILTRSASRAEQLWGDGVKVTAAQIADAREM